LVKDAKKGAADAEKSKGGGILTPFANGEGEKLGEGRWGRRTG